MRRLVLTEHARFYRWDHSSPVPEDSDRVYLESALYRRLHRLDHAQRMEAERVFEWGDASARTKQWVGVVQVPGLQVEILPKIDLEAGWTRNAVEAERVEARRNLLYMLSVSGDVPVRSRDVARMATRRAPLSETLAAIFAERLRRELLRGQDRSYVVQEENLRQFRGKLMVGQQVVHNAAHRERFYCRYEEFSDDTALNRVFRAACTMLLETTRTPATQDTLRHCLLLLDGVKDVPIHPHVLETVRITRGSERFRDVFEFCRLILSSRSPTVQAGEVRSFALLFDMNQVFESFVAGFLAQRVLPDLPGYRVHPQARGQRRHLMQSAGRGVLPLRPDILIREPRGHTLVVDTKWKRLSGEARRRGGVGTADLYQMYAYMERYGARHSILLYPHVPGVTPRDFDVVGRTGELTGSRVSTRFVGLHRDLYSRSGQDALAGELASIIHGGLELVGEGAASELPSTV